MSKTDGNGSFEISYRKSQYADNPGQVEEWRNARITAFADGFGPGWVKYDEIVLGGDPTIRLVEDDVAIEGRVLDLEGKPVAGARAAVVSMSSSPKESLDEWIEGVRANKSVPSMTSILSRSLSLLSVGRWPGIVTDRDGRFQVSGLGRERVVMLHVEGSTIATKRISVVTRHMEPLEQPSYDFQGD